MNATAFPLDTPLAPTETKASTALPQNGLSSREQQQQSAGWDDVIIQPAFEVPLAAKYGGEGVGGATIDSFINLLLDSHTQGCFASCHAETAKHSSSPPPPLCRTLIVSNAC